MLICLVTASLFSIFLRFYVVSKVYLLVSCYTGGVFFLARDFISLSKRYYKLEDWMDFESKVIDCAYSCPYIMG